MIRLYLSKQQCFLSAYLTDPLDIHICNNIKQKALLKVIGLMRENVLIFTMTKNNGKFVPKTSQRLRHFPPQDVRHLIPTQSVKGHNNIPFKPPPSPTLPNIPPFRILIKCLYMISLLLHQMYIAKSTRLE